MNILRSMQIEKETFSDSSGTILDAIFLAS